MPVCQSCGRPIAANAPKGLCPECLLKAGFPTETDPDAASPGAFVPPIPEDLARHFPQLEILEALGHGGMGAVYKARQPSLDRLIALKILPPHAAADTNFAERFTREARALARLNHPNIVAVYEFGQATGISADQPEPPLPYFLMEFVDGANLREVERSGKLTPRETLRIVHQICDALQFAHDEGVVHRDIKPENILLDKKGRVKIADFGIAKILGPAQSDTALTGARDVVGTPSYMAPEQIQSPQAVDHRADIFSLGVVFYELLTGELPIGKFAPPSQRAQVDIRLDEVVLRALEKEPERRYQHAEELKTDVDNIAAHAPAPGARPGGQPEAGTQPLSPVTVEASDKRILPAFLLGLFFGVFGAHRYYVGKIGTGLLQLFTCGGFGIWAVIDWILILCKVFTDKQGRKLTQWT
jgi:serine/threonine protein kinase